MTYLFTDRNSEKTKCYNRAGAPILSTGTSATSGIGSRKSKTSYYVRTKCHHRGKPPHSNLVVL